MDDRLVAALKRNGRASLSELASILGVTRSTVRVRLDRLVQGGEIAGFTVLTRADVRPDAVRGLMMLEIAGRGAEKTMKQLQRMSQVQAVHSTNGTWDLIVEIGTETLEQFDQVLFTIRRVEGVTRSETNLLLSTRR
jgi:DNA-binding Lrp family transcriptional regulator